MGVGVGKVFWRQVLDECGFKGFVEFAQFAFGFVFVVHKCNGGGADVFGEFGQLFGGANHMAGFVLEW